MNEYIAKEWVEFSEKNIRRNFFKKYPLSNRVSRLFSIACGREIWNKFIDERAKKDVEVAELYVDGLVTKDELKKAHDEAWDAYFNRDTSTVTAFYAIAIWATRHVADWRPYYAVSVESVEDYKNHGFILASMCPINFNEQWINSTTTSLAQQIYDKKDFSLMPILADALQDVDCTEDILLHLRSKGPFYKGNYIIDVLTGRRTI